MVQALIMSVTMVVLVLALNAFFGRVAGVDSAEGASKVLEAAIIVFILYIVIVALFGSNLDSVGVPFLHVIEKGMGLSQFFNSDLGGFALECAKLISLVFVITLCSQYLPSGFGGDGLSGQLLRSIVLVMIGVVINHYVLTAAQDAPLFEWAVVALQCLLSGAALMVVPAQIVGRLAGISPESGFVSFLVDKLPETKLGKALSSAATNSLIMVFVIMVFESQFGPLSSMLAAAPTVIYTIGIILIMLIGYRIIIKSFFM